MAEIGSKSLDLRKRGESSLRRRSGDPQREQKQATRKKLLEAAHAVFERYPYNASSVDLIAEQAGVSRTTYYRHFDGKLPIALALFGDMAPFLHSQWRELLSFESPSLDDVGNWIGRQIETIEQDRVLNSVLRQIEAIEPDVQVYRSQYYETLIAVMWPAERPPANRTRSDLRARSILLLFQMDQFLYMFGTQDLDFNREAMMSAMTGVLHEFLQMRREEIGFGPD